MLRLQLLQFIANTGIIIILFLLDFTMPSSNIYFKFVNR